MIPDIPIYDLSPRVQYVTGNGEKMFPLPFPVLEPEHLVVVCGEEILALDEDFVVSGVGDPRGGYVRLLTAATPGQVLTLMRRIPLERLTDFQTAGEFTARMLNLELDRVYMVIQQVAEATGLAVARSPFSADTARLTLPEPVPGRALAWSPDGDALVNTSADIEALGREAEGRASEAATQARKAADSAREATTAASNAKAAEGTIRAVADDATRTIATAADKAAMAASTATAALRDAVDPRRAFVRMNLLKIW